MEQEVELKTVEVATLEDASEYRKARMENKTVVEVPVEKPIEEPPVEETPEAAPETETEADETPVEKPKKNGGGVEKRIGHYAKVAKEAEEKLAAAQREIEELKKPKSVESKPALTGKPDSNNYTDYEEYLADKAAWIWEQKQAAKQQAAYQESQQIKYKEIAESHNERLTMAKMEHEDFDAVVNPVRTPWPAVSPHSDAFNFALVRTKNSGEVVYELAKNPEALAEMGEMDPEDIKQAVYEFALTVKGGTAPKPETTEERPKLKSKAPEPIEPVSTASTKNYVPLDKIEDPVEYRARRRAQLARN